MSRVQSWIELSACRTPWFNMIPHIQPFNGDENASRTTAPVPLVYHVRNTASLASTGQRAPPLTLDPVLWTFWGIWVLYWCEFKINLYWNCGLAKLSIARKGKTWPEQKTPQHLKWSGERGRGGTESRQRNSIKSGLDHRQQLGTAGTALFRHSRRGRKSAEGTVTAKGGGKTNSLHFTSAVIVMGRSESHTHGNK